MIMLLLIATILSIALLLWTGPRLLCPHLSPLWSGRKRVKLSFSPNQLSVYDITVVLGQLASRSIKRSLDVWWWYRDPESITLMDDSSLTMPVRTSQKDLDAYTLAVERTTQTNALWTGSKAMLFLSALTEPAMLLLLAETSCKLCPLGAVNVRNRFELLRPDLCTEHSLKSFSGAGVTASASKHVRRVRRGFEVDLLLTLDIPRGGSTGTITIFRQIFTILQFAKLNQKIARKDQSESDSQPLAYTRVASFDVEYEEPSRWARVCKDYNPIHISAIAAKLFGFSGKIAHGNHMVAKALDLLERCTLPPEYEALYRSQDPVWMEVVFKRPITVPAVLEVTVAKDDTISGSCSDLMPFRICKGGVCIEGKLGRLKDAES
ncbi:hypothetical protein EDD37DRAFT_623773 [Exophiala viscosa]|uniref:MaoC-like domain-containing protein n=1 Tax=Exophiala viscosa TaxID=2486360 RepID=A0AAN6IIV7_9EURO|nr:hypothetical protein EDD36DRAFT_414476 [Exophiala viscosa]KAI1627952.1 hypothetical protein EDD37DRAFT_623773 [Exophiala viscosa]